jgi:hypothetical protein
MSVLTRRRDPHRTDCWLIYYGDVRVGLIARAVCNPNAEPRWQWLCGFYPGSHPGEQRGVQGVQESIECIRRQDVHLVGVCGRHQLLPSFAFRP